MPRPAAAIVGLLLALLAPVAIVAQSAKTGSASSARFLQIVQEYVRGDADHAIGSLATWQEAEVLAEGLSPATDDPRARAAIVSLFTETAMRKGTFGKFSATSPKNILLTGWGLDKNFEAFSYRSYLIVKDLTRIARSRHDLDLLAFVGRWYLVAIAYCHRFRCPAEEGLEAMADHDLNDRPEVALLIGALSEPQAGLFQPTDQIILHMFPLPGQLSAETVTCTGSMIVGPDGCMYRPDDLSNPTREALWGYRRAVKADPSLVEAQLRLGRMLFLINQKKDARPHLEQAFRDAQVRRLDYLTYVAALFLGDLDLSEGRPADAVAAIRVAVGLAPAAHLVNLAYGEALLRNGDSRGWAEARHMFDGEPGPPKQPEPMSYYILNQYWRTASDLKLLREVVRSWE